MKAAIITGPGTTPIYGDFREPSATVEPTQIVTVNASALTNFTKGRASGSHYTSTGAFPIIPGADGVGRTADGHRVYFALPEEPFGALAETTPVDRRRCIAVPDALDDVTAAAIANPGMSTWAALFERAHMQRGETVLVNGATGTAGRIAVQIAKHFGAARVIGTGRNATELAELRALGADAVIPFQLGDGNRAGADEYEKALIAEFERGIDVVIDYLWGESAKTVIVAIVKGVEDAHPVRFVHVGGASGAANIELPGAALRSSAIQLMGSGAKSVPLPTLLAAVGKVFDVVGPAKLQIATKVVPLSTIEANWNAPGKPRVVFTMK